jgi:hypothetical protein
MFESCRGHHVRLQVRGYFWNQRSNADGEWSSRNSTARRRGPHYRRVVAKDKDPDWRKLDDLIGDPKRCRDLLDAYFGPLWQNEKPAGFAGSQFERFGDEAARRASMDRFIAEDVVAISMLSVNVPPHAALYLIADEAGTLSAALTQMPTDVDLVDASDEHLDAALTLWEEVRSLRDVGPTKTSKLLARKRPRLIPIRDSVTWNALGQPTRLWKPLREKLGAGLHETLLHISSDAGVPDEISAIRVLDVLLWMAYRQR